MEIPQILSKQQIPSFLLQNTYFFSKRNEWCVNLPLKLMLHLGSLVRCSANHFFHKLRQNWKGELFFCFKVFCVHLKNRQSFWRTWSCIKTHLVATRKIISIGGKKTEDANFSIIFAFSFKMRKRKRRIFLRSAWLSISIKTWTTEKMQTD